MTSAADALAALDRDDKARLRARRKTLDALLKARRRSLWCARTVRRGLRS